MDELFRAAGVRARYGFETEEVETVRGLATAGVGIAVLPALHGGPLTGSSEVPVMPRRGASVAVQPDTTSPLYAGSAGPSRRIGPERPV